MKNLILVVLLTVLFWSCTSDSSKDNVALIENYIEAVENLDYEAMDDILDDEYLGIGPSSSDSINKENAIKIWIQYVDVFY